MELDEPTAARLTAYPKRVLERSIEHLAGVWDRIRVHLHAREITVPLGLNIAPVGPVPIRATIALGRYFLTGIEVDDWIK